METIRVRRLSIVAMLMVAVATAAPVAGARAAGAAASERGATDLTVALSRSGREGAIALVSGSVVDGEGGAELTLLHPNRHVGVAPLTLDDDGVGSYRDDRAALELRVKGSKVTGSGTLQLDGRSVDVELHGVAIDREDTGQDLLRAGDPSGADQDALEDSFRVRSGRGGRSVEELLADPEAFADLAVYSVGPDERDLAQDPVAALFLQSGKWLVVDAPDAQARADLFPMVHYSDPVDHSPQIAVRLMDPGGSWNTRTLVVGYPTTTAQPGGSRTRMTARHARSYRQRLAAWDDRYQESTAADEVAFRGRSVGIGRAALQSDGAGSGAFEPPELPANSFGYVVTVDESPTYQLGVNGGWQFAVTEDTCTDGYSLATNANWATCPTQLSQTADYSGTDNWYALLQVTGDGENGQPLAMQWQLVYAQDITVNGSSSGELASDNVTNGELNYATPGSYAASLSCAAGEGAANGLTFGIAGDFLPSCPSPMQSTNMIETAWPLGNVTTDFSVSAQPSGTATFAFLNQSSSPNNQITTTDGAQTVGGSWSVSGSSGVFGGQGIAQLSGSYSHDWSTTVDTSVPDWNITPLYNGGAQASVSWSTNSPVTWAELSGGSNDNFGINPLNVSGLDTDSTAAWQSSCMFGAVSTSLVRQIQFADTYTSFDEDSGYIEDSSETSTWTTTQGPVINFNNPSVTLSGELIQQRGAPQGCPGYPTADQDDEP